MTPEKSIVSIIEKEAEDFLIPAYFVSMPIIEDEKRDFEELKSIYIAGRSKSIDDILLKFCHWIGEKGYKINGYDDGQLTTIINQFKANILNNK